MIVLIGLDIGRPKRGGVEMLQIVILVLSAANFVVAGLLVRSALANYPKAINPDMLGMAVFSFGIGILLAVALAVAGKIG